MGIYAATLVALARRNRKGGRNSRLRCDCGGYWFPHRRGGGACEASPTRDHHLRLRQAVYDALPAWKEA